MAIEHTCEKCGDDIKSDPCWCELCVEEKEKVAFDDGYETAKKEFENKAE